MQNIGKQYGAQDRLYKSQYSRVRKFISFYKPYKLLFIADVSCSAITVLASLALPLCIRYITVEALAIGVTEAVPLILKTLGLMLAIILIQAASGIFYDNKGHAMGAMMERDMRNELFSHCQRLPVNFFDREKTGALISRITSDLFNLSEFCHHGPENLFVFLASFIGTAIILFRIDARLTLVVFALLPLMIIYTIFFQGRLRKAYRESREKIAALSAGLEDTLSGIRVVKSFTNEKLEDEKFRRANESFCRGRINISRNEAFYFSAMEFFLAPLVTVGVVAAGAILISRYTLSIPDLIVFLLYIGYLVSPLQRIAQWVGLYQDAMAGFSRFLEIMSLEPENFSTADKQIAESAQREAALGNEKAGKGHLEFVNVSFRYGEELENVLENISLDIRPGEIIALVGFSGVGKTTLCSLLPRFYETSAGKILLDGQDIREIELESLRRSIGMVPQDVYLFDGTIKENISYGKPGASSQELTVAAKRANAHEFIMGLPNGYDTEIGQRGIRLSGGQRQRISIARVFLKNPPVLILDEATSSLDYESERLIHESLDDFMKGRTTLIVAHRNSTIRKAGRIISLTEKGLLELEKGDAAFNLTEQQGTF